MRPNDTTTGHGLRESSRKFAFTSHPHSALLSHARVAFSFRPRVAPSLDLDTKSILPAPTTKPPTRLLRNAICILYTACLCFLEKTKVARLRAYPHARCTKLTPTNNGHATEGKAKGLDSPAATSRVLPKHSRRRDHGSIIQFARKAYIKVNKEQQKGGGGC